MINNEDYIKVWNKVNEHMIIYYRKTLYELEISDVPGYWKDKDGWVYVYHDNRRDCKTGRFLSPYRSWRTLKKYSKEAISMAIEFEDEEVASLWAYDEERGRLLYTFWTRTEESCSGWLALLHPEYSLDIFVIKEV